MSDFGTAEMELVRNLVRRVDKKVDHQVKLAPEGDSVLVSLKQGKQKGEVRLNLDSLRDAKESLASMEALRQRIKRARDAMFSSVGQVPYQKSGLGKPAPIEGGFFMRSGNRQGGGGRGR